MNYILLHQARAQFCSSFLYVAHRNRGTFVINTIWEVVLYARG